jgi:predicted DNA-binding antitoxin AbrB/MazE fold protein
MTISAIFRDGVFQPIGPVKLREGEKVQIEVVRSEPSVSSVILSLKGVWKHATLPTDTDDWVATAISDIRQESGSKLEQIAQELSENLSRG